MNIVREERLAGDHEIALLPGTLDERLFREVCKPPSMKGLSQVAEQAEKAGARIAGAASRKAVTETRPVASARLVADSGHGREAKAGGEAHGAAAPKAEAKPPVDSKPPADAHAQSEHKSIVPPLPGLLPRPQPQARPEAHSEIPLPRPAPPPPRRVQLAHAAPRAATPKVPDMAAPPPPPHHVHWTYDGESGPAKWGSLKPEWSQCDAGKRQSPIDIREGIRVDLTPIKFDYKSSYVAIIDNGHTVQVNVGAGSTINVSGQTYELQQFHFHKPSEERVNGRAYDMVAHLVHKDIDGRLAVVAVLMEKGLENPFVQVLWNNLPLERDVEMRPETGLDLSQLLPAKREYFTYMGSLTTPPCSEGVLWMVIKEPVQLSQEQLGIFARLYRNNARPIQSANSRLIKESR
ncbi:MAG: carbonic anhydrase family protein [Rhodocyclaceae bacterium]|nr:carbonic anhydrase family protein [Rhodocyclaceae bacterium]MBX3669152.1 carbonic anhydrase family protein [Rhodocyclaceae bacterium]